MNNKNIYLEKLIGLQPDKLIICGMGGSGLPGKILETFSTELGIEASIKIWQDYGLPEISRYAGFRAARQSALFIFVSFSGETEETVSGLKEAFKIDGANILVITGGGELMKIAETEKLPLVIIDKGDMEPREASIVMFSALASALQNIGIVKEIPEIPEHLKGKEVDKLIKFIDKGIPLIYTSGQFKSLAYIWKIWLNETAKTPAFTNVLPELDHNEVVGFERRYPLLRTILIKEETDSERIKIRISLTAKLIKKLGGTVEIVKLNGKDRFERFWKGVYLAEDLAKQLALKNKVNPELTKSIATLKAWLKKK